MTKTHAGIKFHTGTKLSPALYGISVYDNMKFHINITTCLSLGPACWCESSWFLHVTQISFLCLQIILQIF